MKFRRAGLVVSLAMLAAAVCPGATWFVATNGTDGATPPWGSSWDYPFATISNAVVQANPHAGSLVLISNGIFNVTNQITVSNGVICRGFTDNPNEVIVDGGGTTRCFYLLGGVLSAVTVTNGYAPSASLSGDGGGIYCSAAGVVSNCVVTGNAAAHYGGGLRVDGGGAVADCMLLNNAAVRGGGAYVNNAQLFSSIIRGNCASGGGGLYLVGAPKIAGCLIVQNTASNNVGGGIYDDQASSMIINCQIISNTVATPVAVAGSGAGSHLSVSYATYSNCVFAFNTFTGGNLSGGGIYTGSGGSPRFFNCLVYSNLAYAGGGFYNHSSSSTWFNCTFTRNRATIDSTASGGGMYFANRANVKGSVVNCIMYDNMSLQAGSNYYIGASATPTFSNCCAMPVLAGGLNGNIAADPLFQSPDEYNFRPAVSSLCVNAGWLEDFMLDASDLDGKSRVDPYNRLVDMGCYEYLSHGTLFGVH